jgi:DNA-binding transcriptional LysR family regulator
VFQEPIFLAVPNTEKYAGRKSIRLSEVGDEGFISLLGSKQFRYICDRFCRYAGIKPRVIFESDNPAAVRNMIAANLGVGFWPGVSWGRIDSEHVLLLEIEDPQCSRDIVITCSKNKTDNRNVESFFEYLKECFETQRKELFDLATSTDAVSGTEI